jgi:hypothetical protein
MSIQVKEVAQNSQNEAPIDLEAFLREVRMVGGEMVDPIVIRNSKERIQIDQANHSAYHSLTPLSVRRVYSIHRLPSLE